MRISLCITHRDELDKTAGAFQKAGRKVISDCVNQQTDPAAKPSDAISESWQQLVEAPAAAPLAAEGEEETGAAAGDDDATSTSSDGRLARGLSGVLKAKGAFKDGLSRSSAAAKSGAQEEVRSDHLVCPVTGSQGERGGGAGARATARRRGGRGQEDRHGETHAQALAQAQTQRGAGTDLEMGGRASY